MTIFHYPLRKKIWFAKLFDNRSLNRFGVRRCPWTICLSRLSAEEQFSDVDYCNDEPKGPWDTVTSTCSHQHLQERLIKGGWISRECDQHLKSIHIFCYYLLVEVLLLSLAFIAFFAFHAAALTQCSKTQVRMGMSLPAPMKSRVAISNNLFKHCAPLFQ